MKDEASGRRNRSLCTCDFFERSGHVEYARPAEGEAHADAAALDGDDEYSRLRAAASVFVELQEEEEHSFKSLLEKEVL